MRNPGNMVRHFVHNNFRKTDVVTYSYHSHEIVFSGNRIHFRNPIGVQNGVNDLFEFRSFNIDENNRCYHFFLLFYFLSAFFAVLALVFVSFGLALDSIFALGAAAMGSTSFSSVLSSAFEPEILLILILVSIWR